MKAISEEAYSDQLVFAAEDPQISNGNALKQLKKPWKILIVDDEEDVHEITRITLRGFVFEKRSVQLFSAYSESDVKRIMTTEKDIALILLDVVMEKDNTGLEIVEYIRKDLKNSLVRIVLRTGQPGKAPEQEVIFAYDINDYKTKPELTAQKLFTSVTACLRAYQNIATIEKSKAGLELIIESTTSLFQNQSIKDFASGVLYRLFKILNIEDTSSVDSAYSVEMPAGEAVIMAGTGQYVRFLDRSLNETLPLDVVAFYDMHKKTGGEIVLENSYIGVFSTKEGFTSLLYIADIPHLSSMDKRLIRIFTGNMAIGFDNLSLSREIVNTQKEVILTLGEVVETRSQETAHHVTRVAEICYLLAVKLGLEEKTADILRLAAPMHDVGKIGVPDALLNKPGKLTPEEFEIVKKHSQIGYEILRKSKRQIMEAAAVIALQHHERWDGEGYPQGLSGSDIHIFGRIAGLADVFDALTHKRCYKDAWPVEEVIDLFKKEGGRHFDPDLTDLFLSHVDEFVLINTRFPE